MTLTIVGAGLAGLLAANLLRKHNPVVLEAQPTLPNNHSAVLRFRSNIIGELLGIPFQRVKMTKSYIPWRNPVADSLAYARKCTGTARSDRSIITSGLEVHERFIAPPDLVSIMAQDVDIKFNAGFKKIGISGKIISTMPMPALMELIGYEPPLFEAFPGLNIAAKVNRTDAYVSLYVPDPRHKFNRVSLTGNELIVEYANIKKLKDDEVVRDTSAALELLGLESVGVCSLPVVHQQRYAKVLPIDDHVRKRFMAHATDVHGIFSLGRYATWRPGLLLDDLVQDIRLIDGWLKGDSSYDVKMFRRKAKV